MRKKFSPRIEDCFRRASDWPDEPEVSPAALAFATRITEDVYKDVYGFARLLDAVLDETRANERHRIFNMGFFELCREFWRDRKITRRPGSRD